MRRGLPLILLVLSVACHRVDDRIAGVGTLELVEVDVAPMTPARVVRVWAEEGDRVHTGDTLLTLTQPTSRPDVEQRRASLASARATLRELEAGSRPREIERARAELAAAEADADRAARDYARSKPLGEAGTISRQALDAARSAAEQATARRDAARQALRLLEEGTRPERIQAARAEVATAQAALAASEATAADLVLTAPVDGTVLSRNAEPGEMLAAGQSALTLGEVRRPWTRVYLSSLVVPRVRVGQAAVAILDGLPDRSFRGRVVAVNDRAEFTPRIALTEKERADLLFGVKVVFDDTTGTLKAGLPATVEILAEGSRR
jgi:HlyD family secretion protein